MRSLLAGLSIVALALAGCAAPPPSATPAATAAPTPTALPTGTPVAVAGGCGDTQVFAGPGPDASLGLGGNPWAAATPASSGIVAYFWYSPPAILHAKSPDGSGEKVLWVVHGPADGPLAVLAHPLDADTPVIRFSFPPAQSPAGNYPSGIAVPTPGCWQLELTVGATHATLDVQVAPKAS